LLSIGIYYSLLLYKKIHYIFFKANPKILVYLTKTILMVSLKNKILSYILLVLEKGGKIVIVKNLHREKVDGLHKIFSE
jgi:hypothetical protein